MQNKFALAIIAFCLCAAGAFAGPLEDGAIAYQNGDYSKALRLWQPLAEQGSAPAEYGVGLIYDLGKGVPQDYAEASRWYRLAAQQGYSFAQFGLGSLYFAGRSVPQDDVAAYMWLSLAAAQGLADATKLRNLTAESMTPDELAEAQRLAQAWKPASP